MNVALTPELEQLVHSRVESGRYLSVNEVIREALTLLEERDRLREIQLERLKKKVAEGLEQLDRGEQIPGKQVFNELRQRNREQQANG